MSAKVVDAIDGSATVYFVGKNRSKSQFTMTLEAFLNQQPDVNDDDADDVDLDSAISFASAKYNGENACRAHNNRRCVLIICLSLHMSLSNMQ
jgi:hypothetical protein